MGVNDIDKYTKNTVFTGLPYFDHSSSKNDFIEVTEWKNGEGFDVEIVSNISSRFQITRGQLKALNTLVSVLDE